MCVVMNNSSYNNSRIIFFFKYGATKGSNSEIVSTMYEISYRFNKLSAEIEDTRVTEVLRLTHKSLYCIGTINNLYHATDNEYAITSNTFVII